MHHAVIPRVPGRPPGTAVQATTQDPQHLELEVSSEANEINTATTHT